MRKLRDFLKNEIYQERLIYVPGVGRALICPICDKYIYDEADMHEALISRGAAGQPDKEGHLMSKYNCVLVHHKCHMSFQGIGGDEVFEKCARHLVKQEGFIAVQDWLISMKKIYRSAGTKALQRFQSIFTET